MVWCARSERENEVGMGRERCEERAVFISCISKECVARSVICFDVVFGVPWSETLGTASFTTAKQSGIYLSKDNM